MAKKKSNFYHVRWNRVRINEALAADVLGVTVEDVRRFDAEGAPVMAERLLLLWDSKRINHADWQGFAFSRDRLRHKSGEIFTGSGVLWERQERQRLEHLDNEIRRLRTWHGLFTVFVDKFVDACTKRLGVTGLEVRLVKK